MSQSNRTIPRRFQADNANALAAGIRDLEDGRPVVLQFEFANYSRRQLGDLNELCQVHGNRLCVRF